MLEMHQRRKLPRLRLTADIEQRANRIIDQYLNRDEKIPEISVKVYAMGKAIAIKSGIMQRQANYLRKNKPSNGNRRDKVKD